MGNRYSFLEAEKKTWIDHTLKFDSEIRKANLNLLPNIKNDSDVYLAHSVSSWGGIEYQHWFVTDKTYFIEFGSANHDIYNARLTINLNLHYNYSTDRKDGVAVHKMNRDIRERILHVLGMSNYSLCLRNCEHVANYIFRGRWVSFQMDAHKDKRRGKFWGMLFDYFSSHMLGSHIRMVNTFPSSIHPHHFKNSENNALYSFTSDHIKLTGVDYYLDCNEDTYNILVIGPSGAGKSRLINMFFNEAICESKCSLYSVTQEIYFIRGRGMVHDVSLEENVQRNIIVADTIGLCDTEWDDSEIINLIKGRISSNFSSIDAIFIVYRIDCLSKQVVSNIKQILEWLHYRRRNNSLRFQFVGTHADCLTNENRESLHQEAISLLEIKTTQKQFEGTDQTFESLVFTGFNPDIAITDETKASITESWRKVSCLLHFSGKRISPNENGFCTIL